MKTYILLGLLILPFFIVPIYVDARCTEPYCSTTYKTIPFGGKVISITIPTVTCETAGGTAPVVLSSNLAGLASAGISATTNNPNAFQKAGNIAGGIYRAIPLYTVQMSSVTHKLLKQPKVGDWILGQQQIIPNLSTCQTDIFGAPIPFPVVKTDNYSVSQKNTLR